MTKYSILVIGKEIEGRSAKLGDIVVYKKCPCVWGRKEISPRFQVIQVEGEFENIDDLRGVAKYDFNKKKFIRRDTTEIFEFQNKITEIYVGDKSMDEKVALELNKGVLPSNLCDFLNIFGYLKLGIGQRRKYFLKTFFPFRNYEGIERFLLLIKKGWYGEIREHLKNLPMTTREVLKRDLFSEDLKALQEKWKVLI